MHKTVNALPHPTLVVDQAFSDEAAPAFVDVAAAAPDV